MASAPGDEVIRSLHAPLHGHWKHLPHTDVQAWLQKAGLSRTRLIRLKKGTGDWEGQLLEARLTVSTSVPRRISRRSI